MATQTKGERIVRDPRILGGEPTIRGTRVPVRSIVILYRYHGDVERVRRAFPMVDAASIQDALAFYAANRQEIERYIAENEADHGE